METRVSLIGKYIGVAAPHAQLDLCRSIGGGKWEPTRRMWLYPASPGAAARIVRTFPSETTIYDEGVAALAKRQDNAEYAKGATLLPNIPGCTRDAWTHQRQAYWFAHELPAAMLALEMGCGKSLVASGLIVNDHDLEFVLIVSPVNVVGVWPRELRKHFDGAYDVLPLRKGSVAKKAKEAEEFLKLTRARRRRACIVINFEAVWRPEFKRFLTKHQPDAVVVDESHRIKSAGGKASRFLHTVGKKAKRRLCLTGTPMPHSPLDVYAQYRFLDESIFGTSNNLFKQRYAVLGGPENNIVVGYKNTKDLHRRFDEIAIRVRKDDALDLPPRVDEDPIRVELNPKARRAYKQMDEIFWTEIESGEVTATNALVKLLRLQQITSGHVPVDGSDSVEHVDSSKEDALYDLLSDIPVTDPVVVFCRFRHDLEAVRRVAGKLKRCYGEISGQHKDLTDTSEMPDEITLMGVQIQSGGVGIDLTKASYACFYSLGFNLGDYLQARDRVHRPGQTRRVTYFHIVAEGTIDERVYAALSKRQNVVEAVLDGGREGDADDEGY